MVRTEKIDIKARRAIETIFLERFTLQIYKTAVGNNKVKVQSWAESYYKIPVRIGKSSVLSLGY